MAKYEVAYAIFRDDVKLADNVIEISLTKKNIQELEEFVVEHDYSPEFVDMPAHIYDKCCEKAWDSVPKLCKSIGEEPTMDIELAFTGWIPTSMIDALSEETRDRVYEKLEEMYPELFEYGDEEDDDAEENDDAIPASFVLNIEDLFLIKSKGLILDGTVAFGRCKAGDKGVLLDKDGNVICETTIANMVVGSTLYENLDEFEDTEGLHVGLLTSLKNRKDAKGAVAVVVE